MCCYWYLFNGVMIHVLLTYFSNSCFLNRKNLFFNDIQLFAWLTKRRIEILETWMDVGHSCWTKKNRYRTYVEKNHKLLNRQKDGQLRLASLQACSRTHTHSHTLTHTHTHSHAFSLLNCFSDGTHFASRRKLRQNHERYFWN
jgi:hypothetical protein